jgi:hypothetical protein
MGAANPAERLGSIAEQVEGRPSPQASDSVSRRLPELPKSIQPCIAGFQLAYRTAMSQDLLVALVAAGAAITASIGAQIIASSLSVAFEVTLATPLLFSSTHQAVQPKNIRSLKLFQFSTMSFACLANVNMFDVAAVEKVTLPFSNPVALPLQFKP